MWTFATISIDTEIASLATSVGARNDGKAVFRNSKK